MAGIYIHIPFCKKACYYCDFHFSTTLKRKKEMVEALCKELHLRKKFLNEPIETIYFGGGTPSLLSKSELSTILNSIFKHYNIKTDAEITIECNPDDLTKETINNLDKLKFNRISLGVQSFYDHILKDLNRNHATTDSIKSIKMIQDQGLSNISIDLIFGIPKLTNEMWISSLEKVISLSIPHISAYALTIEPRTALDNFIKKQKTEPIDETSSTEQFKIGIQVLSQNKYTHYETSNFCKEGFISKHNSSYWLRKPYLGIGPSAHSYKGTKRYWNVSQNISYINHLKESKLCLSSEDLSQKDQYNEFLMTKLRTFWGISYPEVHLIFGNKLAHTFLKRIKPHLDSGMVSDNNGQYKLTEKGKPFTDGITSSLFEV
jgi:oxygen-independent coproporphyrinogen-3 oxidase